MRKTYEEMLHDSFCKYMQKNHGEDWVDRYCQEEQENMLREFCSGAEWFKSLFPMMYFPPCIMPEDIMKPTESEGEEIIIATTDDYIIFYKHRGYDIAYREYWKGHHNDKWKWKVRYGRYVDDDEILCWMRTVI